MKTLLTFSKLKTYILDEMRMSHVYQPVMLQVILDQGGYANVEDIAKALLSHDKSEIEHYKDRTKNMVGRILAKNGIVEPIKDGRKIAGYKLNIDSLSKIETTTLKRLCENRLDEYTEKHGDRIWKRRTQLPRHEHASDCLFCRMGSIRVVSENELCYAIRDGYPVTPLHTLVIPKRHVANYFDLHQSELDAMQGLLDEQYADIPQQDETVTGFNLGVNAGSDAGQTIFHAHMHLIPRRSGDFIDPRGGVRGVIPSKQKY